MITKNQEILKLLDGEQKREIERQAQLKSELNPEKLSELQSRFESERHATQEKIKATIKSHKDELLLNDI
jgi:hypothetical protein